MKKLSLLLISLLACMTLSAGEVTEEEALQKARQFMKGKQFKQRNLRRAASTTGNNFYYVFNAENNDGFVIVSGDDRTTDILGYGNSGNLDMSNLPDNLKWWLESYAAQIAALDTSLKPAAQTTRRAAKAAIPTLIKSQWDQGTPYNYMCPDGDYVDWDEEGYNPDNRCLTGCVATAMAQVMYYWQWPKSCPAIDKYEVIYQSNIWLKGIPATTFQWEKMKDTYGVSETGEAVAKLMRYCGQAVEMEYGVDASSASVSARVMTEVFQYSKNIRNLQRDNYTTAQWEGLVYEELAANRPVLYSGRTEKDGHQFIIDGYDGNGFFHINWGWGGFQDAYYVLSIADPGSEQGYGGSDGAFQFSQKALFGVEPGEDSETLLPKMTSYINSSMPATNYSRSSISENFTNVSLEGEVSASYNLTPTSTLGAEIGWAIYQDDALREVVGWQSVTIPASDYEWFTNNLTLTFGAGLSNGTYRLCQVYCLDGETWTRCANYDACYVAEVTSTKLTVRRAKTDYTVNSTTISNFPEINSPVDITVNVTNNGETTNQTFYLYTQQQGKSTWTKVTKADCHIDPGMSGDLLWTFTPTLTGNYNLKVATSDSEEALTTTELSVAGTVQTTVGGITYLCVPDYQRARVISTNTSNTSLTVQATVTANGKSCKVVAIADKAFYQKSELKSISLPEGLESIGSHAFRQCHCITEITLPSTLKTIGNYAFYNCNGLKFITIPEGVESIGKRAFADMYYLTSVISRITEPFAIPDNTFTYSSWNDETEDYDYYPSSATLYVPIGTTAKYQALSGWTWFAGIEEGERKEAVVDGLRYAYATGGTKATVLRDNSYKELTGDLVIPATVNFDGKDYSVSTIEDRAFWNCNGIKSVIIPESIESIGSAAFEYMYGLTSVISRITEPFAIDDNTFTDIPSTATLYVPIGSKAKYEALSGWTTYFAEIEEGERKEAILNGLKYSYSTGGITATIIKDDSYKLLTALNIPATVTFDGKTYNVTEIASSIFMQCNKIKEVIFPSTLKTIGDYAFWNCNGIQSIMIPASVESIGEEAFQYMFGLETVVSRITEPFAIGDDTFDWGGSPSDATLYVPYGTKAKYEALSGWTMFKEIKESPKAGDADGDGSIDVNDVTSTINHILNKPVANFYFEAADVDGDGVIDVNDVQGIIDRALGKD